MKNLILLALFALSPVALATNNEGGCRGNCGGNDIPASNELKQGQDQDQGQAQGQLQGQEQGQLQGQSQSADATAVAGAIAVSGASADNKNYVTNKNEVNTSDYNANLNKNDNTNIAFGGAGGQGGKGGEGGTAFQGQSQSSDNSNSSNNSSSQSTNVVFEGTGKADHYNKYGNNVAAIAPAIYSSSACTSGGLSGAASALGVGVALGGAKQDPQCTVRENARILAGLNVNMAIDYLCKNDKIDVGAVLGAACVPPVEVPPAPVVVPEVVPPVVTPVPVIEKNVKG